MITQQVI